MAQAIAFYLPQYHPIRENNEWWGAGFTEWTNVTKARPHFKGHYQPHQPADLGYYDLRLSETREAQAALASEYGISAFCYYHYWFTGRRILERPFNEVLASGKPDFPFCLCWANENWTRRWDGRSGEILLEQIYSAEDDLAHFKSLLPAFTDKRYLKRNGCPVFLFYRISLLPDPKATVARWREMARAHGLPGLYLCCVESFGNERPDPRTLGLDAAIEFQPDWNFLGYSERKGTLRRMLKKLGLPVLRKKSHLVIPYPELVDYALAKPRPAYQRYPAVTPMWDNTARRARDGVVFRDSTPALYENWLRRTIERDQPEFVFINAWNEWAEGCHLEPCKKWGRAYLEATRNALSGSRVPQTVS